MSERHSSKTRRVTVVAAPKHAAPAAGTRPLEVAPATSDRWSDLERLFGKSGAYSGCWCMYWRVSSTEFAANGNDGNHGALHDLTKEGATPGLLGYRDDEPVGWISIAPREEFGRLQRSPYMGTVSPFSRAGFREVARRSERRPILRLTL